MSEFTVCRTLGTHPALRYCLLLDDNRIAGGKPDYRGNNILISWRTKETYGPVDALSNENAKLRELVRELWEGYNDPRCEECQLKDTPTCADCPICAREALVIDRMRELGIEVDE